MSTAKVWKIAEPMDSRFARCDLRSPERVLDPPCKKCGLGDKYVMPTPLQFEWEAGSDQIGDFVWPGRGRVAVIEAVVSFLVGKTVSVKAGPIEMVQDPKLKRPKSLRRSKPRVWLPYEGPALVELVVEHHVGILPETTTEVSSKCAQCGREARELTGVEVKQHLWSPEIMDLVPHHVPRIPGQGVFVARADVVTAGLFRLAQFPYAIFCTDEVKALLEGAQFTNLDFLECGDVV